MYSRTTLGSFGSKPKPLLGLNYEVRFYENGKLLADKNFRITKSIEANRTAALGFEKQCH